MRREFPSVSNAFLAGLVVLMALAPAPQQARAENRALYKRCMDHAMRDPTVASDPGYRDAAIAECMDTYGPPRPRVTASGKCRIACQGQEMQCEMHGQGDCGPNFETCSDKPQLACEAAFKRCLKHC